MGLLPITGLLRLTGQNKLSNKLSQIDFKQTVYAERLQFLCRFAAASGFVDQEIFFLMHYNICKNYLQPL